MQTKNYVINLQKTNFLFYLLLVQLIIQYFYCRVNHRFVSDADRVYYKQGESIASLSVRFGLSNQEITKMLKGEIAMSGVNE